MTLLDIPIQVWLGQLLVGLINGAFYAMLSLGLALIFGLLQIVNFAHGALYMLGAFVAYLAADRARHRLLAGADAVAAHRRAVRDRAASGWTLRPIYELVRMSTACCLPSASPS